MNYYEDKISVLIEKTRQINKLNRSIIEIYQEDKFYSDDHYEALLDKLNQFSNLKKEIRSIIVEFPHIKIDDLLISGILKKVNKNHVFFADTLLLKDKDKNVVPPDEELDELRDIFYSWFSHYEYIEGLYETSSLITSYHVPNKLIKYIETARKCYAFQQYIAVYVLCRTIIEISISHKSKQLGQKTDEKHSFSTLLNFACRDDELMQKTAFDIYKYTSEIVHGKIGNNITKKSTHKLFEETIKFVDNLFSYKKK